MEAPAYLCVSMMSLFIFDELKPQSIRFAPFTSFPTLFTSHICLSNRVRDSKQKKEKFYTKKTKEEPNKLKNIL